MIITIVHTPSWSSSLVLPVGAVIDLPKSLAAPLVVSGEAVGTPVATVTHTYPFGGGIAGAYLNLGTVGSQSAMTTLPANVGDTCLRSDIGTGGTTYELTAKPASIAANWQALQGVLNSTSVVTIALVRPNRTARVFVGGGCRVMPSIDGAAQLLLVENAPGQWHEIEISDSPIAAAPTSLSFQRTVGTADCWYGVN